MIYAFNISTPLNTTEANKKSTALRLGRGVIHKVEIDFPPGSQGTLHIAIRRGLNQVWPTNPADYFAADDRLISFPEYYELLWPPFRLVAETWNESLNNAHTVTIRIGLLKRQHALRRLA